MAKSDTFPAEVVRQLVEMANANEALMDGTMKPVLQIIGDTDAVFAVWQDEREPGGVGTLLVKGADIHATGEYRVTAIKCASAEHAEVLRRVAGTDRTH